jgi:branched-chain amino acid transport system substrate-binding protein
MTKKKGFAHALVIFSLFLFIIFPATVSAADGAYKIGYINSHSGFLAHMGSANRDGFLLAVEELNAAGGVNGHKLDVVVYDDESDVTKGVIAFKKLIESDKVLMVVGNNHSGIGIQAASIADKAKVPYIFVGASRWGVIKPGKWVPPADPTEMIDYAVKFWLDETAQIPQLLNYVKKLGKKNFAWMHPGYPFGRTGHSLMMAIYKATGLELVAAEEYGPKDSDMTAQLSKIKAKNPEALIIYGAEPAGALSFKQAREMGMTIPILGSTSLGTRALLDSMGQYMVGLILPLFVTEVPDLAGAANQDMVPLIKKLDQKIMAKHGHRADWLNGEGYDAGLWMADALKTSNPDPANLDQAREKIQKALVTTKGFVGTAAKGI